MAVKALTKDPVRVLITGAAGQIAYSLAPLIAKGYVFGEKQPVILNLLDIPQMMEILNGIVMELQDCAFPLLKNVVATDDEKLAFTGIDAAILLASYPLKQGQTRKDLLTPNAKIYESHGRCLNLYAKKTVKVLVVCSPPNTIALICSRYAPSIPKENFSALTRIDHNRARFQIAQKLKVSPGDVRNVIVWGNHSSTLFPDASYAKVKMQDETVKVTEALKDEAYLQGEFITTVQERGFAVFAARKRTSGITTASAAADQLHDWWQGTPQDEWVSMAVMSDGSYGAPAGVVFSFPVRIDTHRRWHVVGGLVLSDFARKMIQASGKELVDERNEALAICKD
ncbi:malate dehydrogenase, cytoplasmic-like [Dermacentor silvarum]|uniref:malate dehydrogenase, cytoplasmic-like n=1 Tax=Dermacentor silvarum TaxID=543639 RepID=UPI001898379E|nr:malate dehydrogenase, cytoplasmic-like [Dermacentor silvarum]